MSEEINQLEKALKCLAIRVDGSIVADISKKWDKVKANIESLQHEIDSIKKCYNVTSESWKKLAEENRQLKSELSQYSFIADTVSTKLVQERLRYIPKLKSILRQAWVALNRAEWLASEGMCIDEDSGRKITKVIKAIEEGLE